MENYTELPTNVGVSIINKKAPMRRLFEPEAFHLDLLCTILISIPIPTPIIIQIS